MESDIRWREIAAIVAIAVIGAVALVAGLTIVIRYV